MIKSIKIYILNLIFVLTTHLSFSQSSAMDVPESSMEKINLYTTKGIYQFHQVDFQNLNQKDYASFVESTNDFSAISQMFGLGIACIFKPTLFFQPAMAYDLLVQDRQENSQKYKDYKNFDWFIYKGNNFVGRIGLSTLSIDLPQDMLDKIGMDRKDIYTVGASMTENFRGKGLASLIAPMFMQKIESDTTLKNKAILVFTDPDNTPVHKICQKEKIGFEFLGRAEIPFDYKLFKVNQEFDFFIRRCCL